MSNTSDSFNKFENLAKRKNNGEEDYRINENIFGLNLNNIFSQYRIVNSDGTASTSLSKEFKDKIYQEIYQKLQNRFINFNHREVLDKIREIKNNFSKLSNKEGNKLLKTSDAASNIFNKLETLDNYITDNFELSTLPTEYKNRVDFSDNYLNKGDIGLNKEYFNNKIYYPIRTRDIRNNFKEKKNLDDKHVFILGESDYEEKEISIEDIENRLRNCHGLEHLYLKKHEELFNVFSFTVNLFDKYRVSTNIMMFLIKYLIQQGVLVDGMPVPNVPKPYPDPKDKSIKIKIPKTIIKNIGALIKDQEKIQEIIKEMRSKTDTGIEDSTKDRTKKLLYKENPTGPTINPLTRRFIQPQSNPTQHRSNPVRPAPTPTVQPQDRQARSTPQIKNPTRVQSSVHKTINSLLGQGLQNKGKYEIRNQEYQIPPKSSKTPNRLE